MQSEKAQIVQAVRGIVAVKAQPGSGKTMCIPGYLFELPDETNLRSGHAVLVVQPSCYAAAKIAEYFVLLRCTDRRHIHVRTGRHEEQFSRHTHNFSFIT